MGEVTVKFTASGDMERQIGTIVTPAAGRWGSASAEGARRLVKVVTGATRDSIGSRVVATGGMPRVQVFATTRGAYYLETGKGHGPPQPYLRPAVSRVVGGRAL